VNLAARGRHVSIREAGVIAVGPRREQEFALSAPPLLALQQRGRLSVGNGGQKSAAAQSTLTNTSRPANECWLKSGAEAGLSPSGVFSENRHPPRRCRGVAGVGLRDVIATGAWGARAVNGLAVATREVGLPRRRTTHAGHTSIGSLLEAVGLDPLL